MQEKIVEYVYIGDSFSCPFCETKYYLNWEETRPLAVPMEGKPCEHLEPYFLPAYKADEDNRMDMYRVAFTRLKEENAPLAQKLDYLLHSTSPFRAWLARKNPWHTVGITTKGCQNPLAIFLGESLNLAEVWVTPEAAIYVRDRSGEALFIPDPSPRWIHELVRELYKHKGRSWKALEVLAIIEDINRAIY
ncbi:hypothetical protein [Thermoflexus sp.]|uniref:hypothetical protein n=1 Tax=Thermoflexus sp. TaxID=1969742 RepID=UPI003BFFAC7C